MGGMGMNGMGGGQMGGMGQSMMSPNMNPGMNPYQNPMMGFQNPNFNTYVNQQPQQPIQPLQPSQSKNRNSGYPENHRYTPANMANRGNSRSVNKNLQNGPPEFTSLDDLDFEVQSSNIGGNLNFGSNSRGQNRFSDAVVEDEVVSEEKPLSNTITGIVVTASLILVLLGGLYFWHVRKIKRKRIEKLKQEEEDKKRLDDDGGPA